MKHKLMRLMCLVLALVMAFSMLSVSAFARERHRPIANDVIGEGYITISRSWAEPGETVAIYTHPDRGYVVSYVDVLDESGSSVAVSWECWNKFTFKMPASAVTVKAVFIPGWITLAGMLGLFDDGSTDFPFTDVALGTWYYQAVEFVYDYGYMDGVSATRFDPDGALSRGMLAKVLYNVEEEKRDFPTEFSDVPNSAWYADAVNWAAANDIVKGYGKDKFGPEDLVTREQMAAILYRYAELKGYDMSARADLSGYKDADKISAWAKDAMSWAVGNYLISGKGGKTLDPTGTATRAEVAQIVMWFCSNVL